MRGVIMGILKVSLGGVGQFLIASLSWVFLVRIVADFGTEAVGGYGVAVRIIIVALLPGWGMANAAATLVGQNLGAGQPDRAQRSAWLCGHYNMVFMVLVTIFFWAAAPWIVSFFDQGPEADGYSILVYARDQPRLLLLRLRHGARAGLQRRWRQPHAHVAQCHLLLGHRDTAGLPAGYHLRAQAARGLRVGGHLRERPGDPQRRGLPTRTLETGEGLAKLKAES
ncbi:MAG: hypothetical protein IPM68_04510 [Flavobacteriales bacterium]|nr:hypothetical protein [Flavobacteriales bacterium]